MHTVSAERLWEDYSDDSESPALEPRSQRLTDEAIPKTTPRRISQAEASPVLAIAQDNNRAARRLTQEIIRGGWRAAAAGSTVSDQPLGTPGLCDPLPSLNIDDFLGDSADLGGTSFQAKASIPSHQPFTQAATNFVALHHTPASRITRSACRPMSRASVSDGGHTSHMATTTPSSDAPRHLDMNQAASIHKIQERVAGGITTFPDMTTPISAPSWRPNTSMPVHDPQVMVESPTQGAAIPNKGSSSQDASGDDSKLEQAAQCASAQWEFPQPPGSPSNSWQPPQSTPATAHGPPEAPCTGELSPVVWQAQWQNSLRSTPLTGMSKNDAHRGSPGGGRLSSGARAAKTKPPLATQAAPHTEKLSAGAQGAQHRATAPFYFASPPQNRVRRAMPAESPWSEAASNCAPDSDGELTSPGSCTYSSPAAYHPQRFSMPTPTSDTATSHMGSEHRTLNGTPHTTGVSSQRKANSGSLFTNPVFGNGEQAQTCVTSAGEAFDDLPATPGCNPCPAGFGADISPIPSATPRHLISSLVASVSVASVSGLYTTAGPGDGISPAPTQPSVSKGGNTCASQKTSKHRVSTPFGPGVTSPMLRGLEQAMQRSVHSKARRPPPKDKEGYEPGTSPGASSYSTVGSDDLGKNDGLPELFVDASFDLEGLQKAERMGRISSRARPGEMPSPCADLQPADGGFTPKQLIRNMPDLLADFAPEITPRQSIRALNASQSSLGIASDGQQQKAEEVPCVRYGLMEGALNEEQSIESPCSAATCHDGGVRQFQFEEDEEQDVMDLRKALDADVMKQLAELEATEGGAHAGMAEMEMAIRCLVNQDGATNTLQQDIAAAVGSSSVPVTPEGRHHAEVVSLGSPGSPGTLHAPVGGSAPASKLLPSSLAALLDPAHMPLDQAAVVARAEDDVDPTLSLAAKLPRAGRATTTPRISEIGSAIASEPLAPPTLSTDSSPRAAHDTGPMDQTPKDRNQGRRVDTAASSKKHAARSLLATANTASPAAPASAVTTDIGTSKAAATTSSGSSVRKWVGGLLCVLLLATSATFGSHYVAQKGFPSTKNLQASVHKFIEDTLAPSGPLCALYMRFEPLHQTLQDIRWCRPGDALATKKPGAGYSVSHGTLSGNSQQPDHVAVPDSTMTAVPDTHTWPAPGGDHRTLMEAVTTQPDAELAAVPDSSEIPSSTPSESAEQEHVRAFSDPAPAVSAPETHAPAEIDMASNEDESLHPLPDSSTAQPGTATGVTATEPVSVATVPDSDSVTDVGEHVEQNVVQPVYETDAQAREAATTVREVEEPEVPSSADVAGAAEVHEDLVQEATTTTPPVLTDVAAPLQTEPTMAEPERAEPTAQPEPEASPAAGAAAAATELSTAATAATAVPEHVPEDQGAQASSQAFSEVEQQVPTAAAAVVIEQIAEKGGALGDSAPVVAVEAIEAVVVDVHNQLEHHSGADGKPALALDVQDQPATIDVAEVLGVEPDVAVQPLSPAAPSLDEPALVQQLPVQQALETPQYAAPGGEQQVSAAQPSAPAKEVPAAAIPSDSDVVHEAPVVDTPTESPVPIPVEAEPSAVEKTLEVQTEPVALIAETDSVSSSELVKEGQFGDSADADTHEPARIRKSWVVPLTSLILAVVAIGCAAACLFSQGHPALNNAVIAALDTSAETPAKLRSAVVPTVSGRVLHVKGWEGACSIRGTRLELTSDLSDLAPSREGTRLRSLRGRGVVREMEDDDEAL